MVILHIYIYTLLVESSLPLTYFKFVTFYLAFFHRKLLSNFTRRRIKNNVHSLKILNANYLFMEPWFSTPTAAKNRLSFFLIQTQLSHIMDLKTIHSILIERERDTGWKSLKKTDKKWANYVCLNFQKQLFSPNYASLCFYIYRLHNIS